MRNLLILNFIFALAIAIIYPFCIAKMRYTSSMTFLPPASESNSLGLLKGLEGISLSSSQDITDEQIKTIFDGETFSRSIVDKLGLLKRNKERKIELPNPYQRAIRKLHKDLVLVEDEKAGLGYSSINSFTITSEDDNADTAVLLVNTAFNQLDSAVQEISVARAKAKRQFIEKILAERRQQYDSVQAKFLAFQKANKLVDAKEQAKASLSVSGDIQFEIYKLDAQLEMLHRTEGAQSSQASLLNVQRNALESRLRQLETQQKGGVLPGLMHSLDLGPAYLQLSRDVAARAEVMVFLSQQLESERVAEEKTISRLNVTDHAWRPEYKSKPKRSLLLLAILLGEHIFLGGLILLRFYLNRWVFATPWWRALRIALR